MQKRFKIFISYRRKGGYDTAKLLYDRLRLDGYSVFFDMDALENGDFDSELEKKVRKCKDFLLVLSPGIFDRFREPGYNAKDDWVRQEIICALQTNKNIIPLMLEDFAYPKRLPEDIKDLSRKNSIDLNPRHFDTIYEKMKAYFLLSKPRLAVRLKKQMRFLISLVFLAFLALSFYVFMIHTQAKEMKMIADSAILANDAEVAKLKDSLRVAKEQELAIARDSMRIATEVEMAILRDSIDMYIELIESLKTKQKAIPTPKAATVATASTPAKTATKTTVPAKTATTPAKTATTAKKTATTAKKTK
ncbi:MAG: toll/interleukin-1 receptor domain-containing protein [Fibromonadales bacterium]|nr:toll/interleukin-1 receptor domain-containing protein [Fibromonadales bacterium]